MMDKLQKCIDNKRVNNSRTREVVYKLLLKIDECITVDQIIENLNAECSKKVSINTIYRHLRFFIECELAFAIQDDLKRAYYCLYKDETMIFSVCSKCNSVKKLKIDLCDELKDSKFITIHKICKEGK